MLFSVAAVVCGVCFGLALLAAYRKGLRDGADLRRTGAVPPWFEKPEEPAKPDPRLDKILDNIDSYNGTPLGQKEV